MVLTFTAVARSTFDEEGTEATLELMQTALGCNVAWGFISGVLLTMYNLYDRSRPVRLQRSIRATHDDAEAVELVQDELEDDLAEIIPADERQRIYLKVMERVRSCDMPGAKIQAKDFMAALCTFILVVITAIPLTTFLVMDDILLAIRVSNLVLVALLFVVGFCWGRVVHLKAWATGLTIMVMGLAMVGVAELLGG